MKYLFPFGLFLIIHISSLAQKPDSAIFNSEFEKAVFRDYLASKSVKPIDLLAAFKYDKVSDGFEQSIYAFCKTLEDKGIHKYNRKKQIKEIYDKVHARFLKKYETEAYFGEVFSNGNYNCVTASALFALVLDYFKIDYIIKETPNHVYLIADPNGTSFLLESTLPYKGVFQFDERFKKTYIDFLHENKMISEHDFKTTSLDNLFQEHYESAKIITPIQLAALQYYNKGVFSFEAKDYKTSTINFEKADIIYPSPNVKFLYSAALLNLLVDQNARKKYDGQTLAKYTNINHTSQESMEISKNHFKEISNEMVINRPDIVGYNALYSNLIISLGDSIDKRDYTQVFHEMMAYYYYLKNNFEKVLYHSGEAYKVNPENIRTQQLVTESLMKYLQENDRMETMPVDTLIYYSEQFPFLRENTMYVKMIGYCAVRDCMEDGHNFKSEEFKNSMHKLQKFTSQLNDSETGVKMIELVYAEAASENVRNRDYDMAEVVLKQGLEIIPQSELLKSRLKSISGSKEELKQYMMNSPYTVVKVQYITPPAYKADEVRASIVKYIGKCWNVDFYKKDGRTKETKVEQLKFIFFADNKMKFKTGTEEHWGTWKLNATGTSLIFKSNEDQEELIVLVYEASATLMRGIMAPNTAGNKKIEFNSCEK